MSPQELARELNDAADDLRVGMQVAVGTTVAEAHTRARYHSSGEIKAARLRREDHPYAKRHGAPKRDPSRINVQSGEFRAAWEMEGPTDRNGGTEGAVFNTSATARHLEYGTRRMFARPIAERVAAEMEPRFEQLADEGIERALR